ncbi:hypothetical protein U1Q18_030487 [Sarracenia purpurea var. burkii]
MAPWTVARDQSLVVVSMVGVCKVFVACKYGGSAQGFGQVLLGWCRVLVLGLS